MSRDLLSGVWGWLGAKEAGQSKGGMGSVRSAAQPTRIPPPHCLPPFLMHLMRMRMLHAEHVTVDFDVIEMHDKCMHVQCG